MEMSCAPIVAGMAEFWILSTIFDTSLILNLVGDSSLDMSSYVVFFW
jgi:hypothetical protein